MKQLLGSGAQLGFSERGMGGVSVVCKIQKLGFGHWFDNFCRKRVLKVMGN